MRMLISLDALELAPRLILEVELVSQQDEDSDFSSNCEAS